MHIRAESGGSTVWERQQSCDRLPSVVEITKMYSSTTGRILAAIGYCSVTGLPSVVQVPVQEAENLRLVAKQHSTHLVPHMHTMGTSCAQLCSLLSIHVGASNENAA